MSVPLYVGNTPNRLTGPETFSADTDIYHAWLPTAITAWNADIAALNTNDTRDTSTSSVSIGTGAKVFTVSAGKSFSAGQYLIFADSLAPTVNSMVVQVQDYSSSTGVMNVLAVTFVGSGTKTSWIISLTTMPIYGTAGRTFLDVKQLQSIDYSFASGSLTLKLNPTNIDYRSSNLTVGTPVNVVNSSQVITTISAGSTAGTSSGVPSTLLIFAINNAGQTELAWTNILNPSIFNEQGLITTTAEGGTGTADSASTVYSTTARVGVAYRVIGIFKSTQTTAGTWAQTAELVHPVGGVPLVSAASRQELDRVAPAFSAYRASSQAITSSVFTKVQCATEEFDTKNSYDAVTNYRFQPSVAGIYTVGFSVGCEGSVGATRCISAIFKNGAEYKRGSDGSFAANNALRSNGSSLVYLNGSSDYIELYAYIIATTASISGLIYTTYFQAALNNAVTI